MPRILGAIRGRRQGGGSEVKGTSAFVKVKRVAHVSRSRISGQNFAVQMLVNLVPKHLP
jgi:hypothetical protein